MKKYVDQLIESEQNRTYVNIEHLVKDLVDEITQQISMAVSKNGTCHMVFPGGTSPRRVLEVLRERDVPWSLLHLYPSDERCVPPEDPKRNDRLIDELLLPYIPLREEHIHRIPAELGPEDGAYRYSKLLKNTPNFDIVLVGVGIDGHTASLFPNHPALLDDRDAVPVLNAPKPPPSRVSIGLRRLRKAINRHVVVIGREKRELFSASKRCLNIPVMGLDAKLWIAP